VRVERGGRKSGWCRGGMSGEGERDMTPPLFRKTFSDFQGTRRRQETFTLLLELFLLRILPLILSTSSRSHF
jgi:hypothetical protein